MISKASIAAILLAAAVSPALAAERTARFTVDLKVVGKEYWHNAGAGDAANVRYVQHVTFSTAVRTDGEIVDFNSKDPGYGQQQMAKATQVSRAVTQARGQKPMTQAEFQSRVQSAQAACKDDMSCLMNLSNKVAEWTLQMQAGDTTAAPAEQGSGRYLNYFGFENCGAKVHIDMENVTEGHFADVQGSVPFSVTSKANHDAAPIARELLCTGTNFVVDTERKQLHGDGWLVNPPTGVTTRVSRGRTTTSQSDIPFREEIIAWASEQLRVAPLTGAKKGVVKLKNTNGTGIPFVVTQGGGTAEVEMTWRFE
jgi:hypothetical protein